jgi:anti-sigma B factor antagonist
VTKEGKMQIEENSRSNTNGKILRLTGRFDTLNAEPEQTCIDEETESEPANLVVNLQDVGFVDSTGLATLVAGMKRSREMKGDLRICGLQQPVRMIFELTRLDKAFEIFNSEEEAVQAFVA